MPVTIETLGEELVLLAHRHPGGLAAAYRSIERTVGRFHGSANTFRKFSNIKSIDGLDDEDKFRLWMLVTAYGADPEAFGLSDDVIPSHIRDTEWLKRNLVHPPGLEPGTHWLRVNERGLPFKPTTLRPGSTRPRTRAA